MALINYPSKYNSQQDKKKVQDHAAFVNFVLKETENKIQNQNDHKKNQKNFTF